MFQNCRKFNEEGSMIYEDAIKLEKILRDKVKELGPLNDSKPPEKKVLREHKDHREHRDRDSKRYFSFYIYFIFLNSNLK